MVGVRVRPESHDPVVVKVCNRAAECLNRLEKARHESDRQLQAFLQRHAVVDFVQPRNLRAHHRGHALLGPQCPRARPVNIRADLEPSKRLDDPRGEELVETVDAVTNDQP
eukprot:CAMPEP_0180125902 /NCGR_PEP_ID=MMETSP0986-20121125/5424_1 /TAXON_ID=697907 /ORGANISM="non described non described, Strain CCMP2293" /LENGTH=110 /DNA_ID=CAMNT_0022065323 /DNA_START=557 /DNA_END=889 /DNA_ORIENTATION=-